MDIMERRVGEAFKKYRERIKEEAGKIKDYLRGKVIKGTECEYVPKVSPINPPPCLSRKQKEYRKMRNKMARRSRRINRLKNA